MQLSFIIKQTNTLLHERSNRGLALRFVTFLVLYLMGRHLQLLFDNTSPGKALLDPLYERMSFFTTRTCCLVLRFTYPDIHTSMDHAIYIAGKATIRMFPGCSGLMPMIRLSFVLLFYPLPWYKKVYLWPLSMAILIFASTFHFILLVPIATSYPGWYSLAHNWLTRIIFYGFYFLCWMMWEKAEKWHSAV